MDELIVRLNENRNKNAFAKTFWPKIKGFRATKFLQFRNSDKHFRTIELLNKKRFIILDDEEERLVTYEEKNEFWTVINQNGWTNYIVWFQRVQNSQISEIETIEHDENNCKRIIIGATRKKQ